ncbi:MAG: kelch repeat-containing protein [Candidatus Poribacteria bacterium]
MKRYFVLAILVIVGLLALSSISSAKWTKKADMPIALFMVSASDVNGKIYIIGTDVNRSLMTVLEYDPVTDKWMSKSDAIATGNFSLSTGSSSICAMNGKIYVFGGVSSDGKILSTVEEYDPATNTWTKKADMPTPRYVFSTSAVDGKIYAIGGMGGTNSINDVDVKIHSTVEEYDPAADTWTKKADAPMARVMFSTSVVNGKIYTIGGMDSLLLLGASEERDLENVTTGTFVKGIVEEYDPKVDKWTRKADMPTPRFVFSTSVSNGKIYAFGGTNENSDSLSTVEEYDPIKDEWLKKDDMPTPKAALSTCAVNGNIYVFGGVGGAEQKILLTVEEYNPNEISKNTLRKVLTENSIDTTNKDMLDIDKVIKGDCELNDPKMFCIAYYLGDGSGGLGNQLYVCLYKKDENKWLYEVFNVEELTDYGWGVITDIQYSKDHIYLSAHRTPSAEITYILSNELKFQDALYGWILAIFDDETIVYYNSQVHFAPTHYAKISIYNPGTKKTQMIYPMKPYQKIRLEHIRKVKEAYNKRGKDWLRERNHHGDPELFDNYVKDDVAINNSTHSLAFVICYDNGEISEAFPETTPETMDVAYIYPNVNNGKKMTYKEIFLSDLKEKYGDIPISEYLQSERLNEIFGRD